MNSINLPSCLIVSSAEGLRQGPALNDIASLILNTSLPQTIYRENVESEHKVLHNLKTLVKEISTLLPNNLSKLTAKDLMTDDSKLFLLLRWMVKVLDFPFYQKLKSSFAHIYSKAADVPRKEESVKRFEDYKPGLNSSSGGLVVKGIDLVKVLKDMHVFTGRSFEEFLAQCESGELLADLINIIEGKEERIKGIIRKSKSSTVKSANVMKVLRYLREFPKMPGTYIWSDKEILEGNLEVISGLIYDVLSFYRKLPRPATTSINRSSIFPGPSLELNSPRIMVQRNPSPKRPPVTSKLADPKPRKEIIPEEMPERPIVLSEETKERISEWLITLDLGHLVVNPSGDFSGDNLRNGVILCELAALIQRKGSLVKHASPKSVLEARENIEVAFAVFRAHDRGVPISLLSNPNRVIKGESEAVWGLLCHVMLAYPNLVSSSPLFAFKELPYSADEIKELQDSLLAFILSKGVLDRSRIPASFQELLPDIVSGVLLCDLVSRVIEKPIHGVFRSPTTQALALSNVKKAIEPLRVLRKMGQKFVFFEEEILKGNLAIILGLLEDLHRFADGLPPRQRGENYHKDGPYYGRPLTNILRVNKSHQKLNLSVSSDFYDKNQNSPGSRGINHSQSSVIADFKSIETGPGFEFNENLAGFQWLLYLGLVIPESLNMNEEIIPEFKTGELFSQIIEKLERNKIQGLHPKVHNQAACLHNLGKVFGLLRNKPGFPSFLCFCEEEVYRGDGEIIRAVLSEVYKIYRRTINSFKGFAVKRLALD